MVGIDIGSQALSHLEKEEKERLLEVWRKKTGGW